MILAIGGPAAHTWTEVVVTVGQAMGQKLPVNYIALGEDVPLLPPTAGGLLNGTETYESPVDMRATAARFGVELTTLEDFAQMAFGANA